MSDYLTAIEAADDHMFRIDPLPMRNRPRRFHPVKVRPIEILDRVARAADQMMMCGQIDIEAGCIVDMQYPTNQAILFEGRDRPIDRIQRDRLQLLLHPRKDILYRRMLGLLHQGPKDRRPLVGHP